MRPVVLKMHVSLDGYVRDAQGEVADWIVDAPMDLALTETSTFPAGAVALTSARTPAGNVND